MEEMMKGWEMKMKEPGMVKVRMTRKWEMCRSDTIIQTLTGLLDSHPIISSRRRKVSLNPTQSNPPTNYSLLTCTQSPSPPPIVNLDPSLILTTETHPTEEFTTIASVIRSVENRMRDSDSEVEKMEWIECGKARNELQRSVLDRKGVFWPVAVAVWRDFVVVEG
jgi:hypothetical protein